MLPSNLKKVAEEMAEKEWNIRKKRRGFKPYFDGDICVLSEGKHGRIIIDASDYDIVKEYSWCGHKMIRSGLCYARARSKNETKSYITLHRLITGQPSFFVDHINGNGLDNRRVNLRLTTHIGNMHSGRSSKEGSPCGVFFCDKENHFKSQIVVNGKSYYLGAFKTEMQASHIYRRVRNIVADLIAFKVKEEIESNTKLRKLNEEVS